MRVKSAFLITGSRPTRFLKRMFPGFRSRARALFATRFNTKVSVHKFLAARFKTKVLAHKRLLSEAALGYCKYQNIAFVFQVFNKESNCDKILTPFIEKRCSNMIVFADGCIDGSALAWHKRLMGKNHLVVAANDLHEIRNYRLSLEIANSWGCSHVVLLQDDDVYDERIFDWLDSALKASSHYEAAIVGGNGGSDLDSSFPYQRADYGLQSAEFVISNLKDSNSYFSLGSYERMLIPSGFVAARGMMPHKFVASVDRAPQLIKVELARQLSLFPKELEPYQYDDYYNCFKSWLNGHPIVLMPFQKVDTDVGVGGMRLYNDINIHSRPFHFIRNWNFVMDSFSDSFAEIDKFVSDSNRKWLI